MSEGSPTKKAEGPEYIRIEFDLPRRYNWSTGRYLGKVYAEAKENKKMVAPRCPKCKQLWARPPSPVCPKCKVDMGWDWVELPLTGTIFQYTYQVYPLWDPHEGERWSNPHPPAIILLDNGIYFRHLLEETDTKKLKEGMRVQAVWEEDYEKRGQGFQDILYFRTIEE